MPDKFYVFIPKQAKKSIKKIPLPWQFRIMQALSALERDPFFGERMAGKLQGKRKIRIWPYRIIYKIDAKKKIVMIAEVGHRGGHYFGRVKGRAEYWDCPKCYWMK